MVDVVIVTFYGIFSRGLLGTISGDDAARYVVSVGTGVIWIYVAYRVIYVCLYPCQIERFFQVVREYPRAAFIVPVYPECAA